MMEEYSEDEEMAACTLAICASVIHQRKKSCEKKRQRAEWVQDWLMLRDERSAYNMIMEELRLQDAESFRKYLRMNTAVFEV